MPFHDYVSGNGVLVYDTRNTHVGRLHTEDGYIIGKVSNSDGHFWGVFRRQIYTDTTNHQHEVRYQNIPVLVHAEFQIQPVLSNKIK